MTAVLRAADLRDATLAALDALRLARAAIDDANVFPVPDSDTGTNMVLTFEAVAAALRAAGGSDAEIARAITSGSLTGARGNSGVITAQILRAWADAVAARPAGPDAMADAFARASTLAYEAVLHPAEGTILSVVRAAADAAGFERSSIDAQFAAAARAGADELALSPQRMTVLAKAGVVDAGGMGLVEILFAMARCLGAEIRDPLPHNLYVSRANGGRDVPELTYALEVQYLLRADDERLPALRRALGEIGDSVAVIGGDGGWRVHVHTDDRERAIELGRALGEVTGIEVVDLAAQLSELSGTRGIALARADDTAELIAFADGDGVRALYEELGATVVTDGDALARAIAAARAAHIVVLPNGADALAQRAVAATNGTPVTVLPSRDVAHGLAAAIAFSDARAARANVEEMREALERVRTGSAAADAEIGRLVRDLAAGEAEIVTVLCARDVGDDERARIGASLREAFPGLEVEVHGAGQPSPRFLVSVE